jgi:O-acetyl-ADP-ribose deacetylase (regulator of RNase III)
MDGGIDSAYRGFFGVEIESRFQKHIGTMHEGELTVGQAIVLETGHGAIPFMVAAPTMRVPTNIHDTVNVYLAFRAALLAVRLHNASGGYIIRSLLAPSFGTGVGGMNYARAARQMAAAYRAVVLGERRHLADARSVWRRHHELLRYRIAPAIGIRQSPQRSIHTRCSCGRIPTHQRHPNCSKGVIHERHRRHQVSTIGTCSSVRFSPTERATKRFGNR